LKKMRVQLLPFGILKDRLHAAPRELPAEATVGDLLAQLRLESGSDFPLAQLIGRIAVSVNEEYAHTEQILRDDDLVGLLPPVSGGAGVQTPPIVSYLTHEPIPAEELIAAAKGGTDGAVVVFDGIVRNNTRGRQTLYLDYEAYDEMAVKQIGELTERAIADFGIRHITLVHRLGRLRIGETSILIVVAAAHRAAAFEACRWLIDTLKRTVPIWKKETFVDGAVWADGEPFPADLVAAPPTASLTEDSEPES
jgi:molybdopterin synthase catalytic subunit/sulfur carrier protein ThiS